MSSTTFHDYPRELGMEGAHHITIEVHGDAAFGAKVIHTLASSDHATASCRLRPLYRTVEGLNILDTFTLLS